MDLKIINKNLIPILIVVGALIIAGAIFYIDYQEKAEKNEESLAEILSPQEAADKAFNFIKQNLMG